MQGPVALSLARVVRPTNPGTRNRSEVNMTEDFPTTEVLPLFQRSYGPIALKYEVKLERRQLVGFSMHRPDCILGHWCTVILGYT